jgi:hypothetical protein
MIGNQAEEDEEGYGENAERPDLMLFMFHF